MRFASAGEAPAVEIAIASGPLRTIAGRMKLHSGGTSTTLTSIARRSASSKTRMLTSVSFVAAIAMNVVSRSPVSYGRCSQAIEPSSASSRSGAITSGARRTTAASHAGGGAGPAGGVAGGQALDLPEAAPPAADDDAAAPGQPQAGDVEGGLEHP